MVPKELGGDEADLPTVLAVYEEVSRADGSTGWTLLANATTSAFAGAYTGRAAVDAMFGGTAPVAAGQFSPRGTAARTDDGDALHGERLLQLRQRERARDVDRRRRARAARRRVRAGAVGAARHPRLLRAARPGGRSSATGTSWGSPAPGATTTRCPSRRVEEDFTFDLVNAEAAARRPGVPPRRARAHRGGPRRVRARRRAAGHGGDAHASCRPSTASAPSRCATSRCSATTTRSTTPRCSPRARSCTSRSRRAGHPRRRRRPDARAAAAAAPVDDVRHPRRHGGGALRVHHRRHRRVAAGRAAAVLPRPPRRDPAPRGRRQHASSTPPRRCSSRGAEHGARGVTGHVAVVTGAGSGIGRSLAVRFAAEGMRVVAADVEAGALTETDGASSAPVRDGESCAWTDVAPRRRGRAPGRHRVRRSVGAVDVLCNNAGVFQGGLIWETQPRRLRVDARCQPVGHPARHPRVRAAHGARPAPTATS